MAEVNIFGPVDSILASGIGLGEVLVIEVIILALVLANFGTRKIAHEHQKSQAAESAEAVSRFVPHEVTNVLLVVAAFYYMTVDHHAGLVMSVLVLGVVLTDFFEFEARKVEARRDLSLDRPKGALVAGVVALSYAGYQVVNFLIKGPISAII
jgi:hypothetical protein